MAFLFPEAPRGIATRRLLTDHLKKGTLAITDKVLVIGASNYERELFGSLGFQHVEYSQLRAEEKPVDARYLPFPDESYDLVFVEATIHHLDKPHLGIYEMVRTSRRAVMICEAQDHLILRLFVALKLSLEYEVAAVLANGNIRGGVNDGSIPNFIYRWSMRELYKLFATLDPKRKPELYWSFAWESHGSGGLAGRLLSHLGNAVAPSWGNSFALLYLKNQGPLQPWIDPQTLDFRPIGGHSSSS